jgi:regulator of RNase E activity RraA
VVVSTGGTPSTRNALWGERLSTAAKARGARGAVIDGLVRDVKQIEQLKFRVFAIGINPLDGKGRGIVNAYNMPGICSGVMVNPGDLVCADYDGVIVIPPEVLPNVIRLAKEQVSGEDHSRPQLMPGAYFARCLP